MILLWGVIFGLLAGYARAYVGGCRVQMPAVRGIGLLIVAFVPQFLAFFLPLTRTITSTRTASFALLLSQALLLVVVFLNRRLWAFWLMGAGLVMNLTVISANGGLMPISPTTIHHLSPDYPLTTEQLGSRMGYSKDVVLPVEDTRLAWLSDRFVVPDWYPQRVAFSLGDVLIASGAFALFWIAGRCSDKYEELT